METITYQVGNLKDAREWFETLLYGKPRPGEITDPTIFTDIPNQGKASPTLVLTRKDIPEEEIHYWKISDEAYKALFRNFPKATEIGEALRPSSACERCEKGALDYLYEESKQPFLPIRRRIGVIVNPNIKIMKEA